MHSIGLKPRINKERCASLEEEKNGLKKWIRLAPGGFESNTQPSDLVSDALPLRNGSGRNIWTNIIYLSESRVSFAIHLYICCF
jgi:hypothetical protein